MKKETRNNLNPTPEKMGPHTADLKGTEVVEGLKYSGHKPNGEPKKVGDGNKHWSGH